MKKIAFTLIELLVVIVIIGILSGIGISQFKSYQEKARLAKARFAAAQTEKILLAEASTLSLEKKDLLMAWYSFDDQNDVSLSNPYIVDHSNSENHLNSLYGTSTYEQSDDTGIGIGKSLKINGNRRLFQRLQYDVNDAPINKITIAGWIKLKEESPNNGEVAFINFAAKSGISIRNTGEVIMYIDNKANGNFVESTKKLSQDKWYYIVGSYDGDVLRIWVDGELLAEKPNVTNTDTMAQGARLYLSFYNDAYSGFLDEIMILPYGFDGEKIN